MTIVTDLSCDNCGASHSDDDIFCENCGYDFITGSLPRPDEGYPIAASPLFGTPPPETQPVQPDTRQWSTNASGSHPRLLPLWTVSIGVDRSYYEEVVSQGELVFPDNFGAEMSIDIATTEVHIGRTSESRLISPDLDIGALTGDPAVSSRHAVISVGANGTMSVTDLGSTNGTFVGSIGSEALTIGVPVPIDPTTPVFLGAWTIIRASVAMDQPAT